MDRKVVSAFAIVAAALMAAGLQAMAQTTTLVSTGSVWKYLDNGSDQGTAWRGTSFNDGTWSSGAAQLGFGDGDETTVLKQTNNAGLTNITYYFRRTFNVDDANFVTNLLLRVLRDDGVVVYLNGTEVYRNNMPAGDVNNQTLASTAASDDGTVFFPSNPSASLLTTGPNVLAVEVHQNATSSTDVSFDLELISNFTPTAPVVSITSPASGSTIAAANVTIRAAASDVDGTITVVEFFQAATKLGERTVPDSSTGLTNNYSFTAVGLTPGTYTFYVKATDNTGLNTDSATVVVQVQAPPPTLLARGSTWKYLDGGTNPGPTWTTLNHDDSAWASGTAPLGDNLEGTLQYCVTVVNIGSASARAPSVVFRKKFNVADASAYGSLTLNLQYDDGAVVYLNGTEILRDGIGTGTTLNDFASRTASFGDGGETNYFPFVVPATALVTGTNIVAVEIHQVSATSSDLQFDLEIAGKVAPSVAITNPVNGATLTAPVNFALGVQASDLDGSIARVDFYEGLSSLGSDTTAPYSVNVTGLTEGSHTFTAVATDNDGNTSTSNPITINVVDPNPPTLVSAFAGTSTRVSVTFSKRVVAPSALNANNYAVNGGIVVSAAAYGSSSNQVVLTTSSLNPATTYTLTVNNVQDGAGNTIAPNSQITFQVVGFISGDIGAPAIAGSATAAGNGFDLTGAGSDIGGTSDQFFFNYESSQRSGDFDVKVRIASLGHSDLWAKAALMAREALSVNSRFAASVATPDLSGCFFLSRTNTGSGATMSGYSPATYPNTWLRLKRAGNQFTGYSSLDGDTWAALGTINIAMPNNVYVGIAVTSKNTAQATTVQMRDFASVTGGSVGSLALNKEPLGASSRKSGLVISEIMYHARTVDTNHSLEFIEIFNSNPFFENIGGYRISGSVDYTFPPNTVIQGGSFLVVARDPGYVQSYYGITGVQGPWDGTPTNAPGISTNNLPGGSGTVRLRNPAGAVLLEVQYQGRPPWPVAADGTGHSLVLARPSYGEGYPMAWDASELIGGSPGKHEPFLADPLRSVVINEFLAHTDPPLEDYVELYNHANQAVNLSGAYLTDEATTNKYRIPNGTIIPARGFVSFTVATNVTGFALSHSGERIYLVNSNQTKVIDAVDFGPQENGVSTGRVPDGSPYFYRLANRTPAAANGPIRNDPIVINEVMFSPISGDSDDEYIELYNRGTQAVNLGGWKFVDGINFTFPANAVIASNAYFVIAKNAARLMSNYANLNSGNLVGDYDGTLANRGERIALAMPDYDVSTNSSGKVVTNADYVVVNDVTYKDGGRWSNWADGGGSSLELKDPRSDNRLPSNWADSDESNKGIWTTIETTGPLGEVLGSPVNDELLVSLLGVGECLVDEVELRNNGGANVLTNGGFELGLGGWVAQGSHDLSSVENVGFAGTKSLHIRAASRGDNGGNRVRTTPLSPNASGLVTLRAKVKWLRGWPELLLRIHGGSLEVGGRMQIQRNLGTPGAANSRLVPNAGPAVYDVVHSPILPAANDPVVVTAKATDPDGLGSLMLKYRVDPTATYTSVTMVDNGVGGDTIAGDGIYSGTIPGQTSGAVVAFYVEATDGSGAANTFPQEIFPTAPLTRIFPTDAVTRECVIRWDDTQLPGSFSTYHLWLTSGNTARWNTRRPVLDNAPLDGTFVYNNFRVIYNMKPLYAGSPWHRGAMQSGPDGTLRVDFTISFPDDDRFLGATDCVWNNPGNPSGTDTSDHSGQSEQTSYLIFKEIGVHYNYRRYMHLFVNGNRRSTYGANVLFIMEDSQQANGDIVDEWYPDDTEGTLYKIEDWFEFPDNGDDFSTNNDADFTRRNIPGTSTINVAPYRFMFRRRAVGAGESANDYSTFLGLITAISPTTDINGPVDLNSFSELADIEQWMRIIACQHTCGNWDSYGYRRGKNSYTYKPKNGKFALWTWDIDFTMGIGGDGEGQDLFDNGGGSPDGDERMGVMWNTPAIRRMYLRAFQDIINGPLTESYMYPILDAKAAAMTANGVQVDTGSSVGVGRIKTFVTGRRSYIASQLALVNAPFAINGSTSYTTNGPVVDIRGTAPFMIKDIYINDVLYPIAWNSVTSWTARVVLNPGSNGFNIRAFDRLGNPVDTPRLVSVNYTGSSVSPEGVVIFNEIMYNPTTPDASFVELLNTSSTVFDMSGWRVKGLDYTFPIGSILNGGQFIVLAKSRAAYSSAFGGAPGAFAEFPGNLDPDGETLTLIKPGQNPSQDLIIDKVKYENKAPWPATANGSGPSLQLTDPAQDNARVSNWTDGQNWRFYTYTGVPGSGATRLIFYLDNIGSLYVDSPYLAAGSVAESGPNLLQNADFEAGLSPWTTAGNHINSVVSSATAYRGTKSLQLVSTGIGGAGGNVGQNVSGINASNAYTFSFWYLPTTNALTVQFRLSSNYRTGLSTNPPVNVRPILATPGQTNGQPNVPPVTLPPYPMVWLNEVQAVNQTGITDNVGDRDPWIELYNSSGSAISLDGYYLANNFANLTQWAFPAGTTINPGEFKIIWADGETGESTPSVLHTGFALTGPSGSVALSRLLNGQPQIVDYMNYVGQQPSRSYGSFPDGQLFDRSLFFNVTPGGTNKASGATVFINEWMADNVQTLADPADGNFEDWFELYNPGTDPVDLSGHFLTDNLANPNQFRIPDGVVIPAGGYLLVWADGETGQYTTNRPDLHANFQLRAGGEQIGLFTPAGAMVDGLTFGPQLSDISEGRYPDGNSAPFYAMSTPTPRAANVIEGTGENQRPDITPIGDKYVILGQTLSFTVHATDPDSGQTLTYSLVTPLSGATIASSSGQFQWTPTPAQTPSVNNVEVRAVDNGTPPLDATRSFTIYVSPPPQVSIRTTPGGVGVTLAFPTIAGKHYQVFYKNNLDDASWISLGASQLATGSSIEINDDIGARPHRFYRIQVLD